MTLVQVIKQDQKKIFVAGVLFLLAYVPTFIWMWDRWWARDSYYSHGIFIPFVTGYLLWQIKDELAKTECKESAWGMRLIVMGLLIHVISSLPFIRVYFTSGFSMLIVLSGIVLYFFGAKVFKKAVFPILFLAFMLPVPLDFIADITFKLKLFVSKMATLILNKIGIEAAQFGSIIQMRKTTAVVDDVCSGLRSLISLTALGSVFAYWFKSSVFKRAFLFFSTIPIAVITNVCRAVALAAVSEIWGPQYAEGTFHTIIGLTFFGMAIILLFSIRKLIE